MIRIDKYASIQPANVEATETQVQPAATSQPQSEAVSNAPTPAANGANTWQRASLVQDGITQQTKLFDSYEHSKAEVEQAKEAREDRQSGALFGSIFLGPIVGTFIGKEVDQSQSKREELKNKIKEKQEDIQRLQKELEEAKDNSGWRIFASWFGDDGGQSEMGQATNSNPLKDLAIEAGPKLHDPDED